MGAGILLRNLLVLALLVTGSCLAGRTSAEPLRLDRSKSPQSLALYTSYYHDEQGRDELQDVLAKVDQGRFQPLVDGKTSFGFRTGAFWFHAGVVNEASDHRLWLLVQEYALSDRIDVHAVRPDGTVQHWAGGDHLSFSQRSIRHRHPNVLLDLPRGEPVTVLVRVQSESSMQVPLVFYTPTAFAQKVSDAQFAIGVYYGILLALFFYKLALWLTLRDSSYFWYLFHISAFGMVLFTLNGLGFEYFWPESAWLADTAVPISICLALIGMQQFSRKFLELGKRWPAGDRVALGIIVFLIVLGVASLVLPYRVVTPIASLAVFPTIGWVLASTITVLRKGYRPARIFLLAWFLFLVGTGMFSAVAFDVLPKNFLTEYGVQIGSALEMLLLSVALGYRYASLRNQNERIVHEARDQLEFKVEQRTSELRQALDQLEDAHQQLSEFSRHDGLTELYNRAHFHEAFERLISESRSGQTPISLLMIDLDHFKHINDTYGHLVGDDCLRWTSNTMAAALRPHNALLARFGGEESVAALPGMDLAQAMAVAEHVRQSLRQRPCRSGELDIGITASIGVHTVDLTRRDGIDAALQVADQALYVAKSEGRDCVRSM